VAKMVAFIVKKKVPKKMALSNRDKSLILK
jgi:hypothetical protein